MQPTVAMVCLVICLCCTKMVHWGKVVNAAITKLLWPLVILCVTGMGLPTDFTGSSSQGSRGSEDSHTKPIQHCM